MASASNSFELQTKADEWIDVTPAEELLRSQLARLQEAFVKCTEQLDSSRLENDLLRDRGTALENETKDLRSLLDRTHLDLETVQNELKTTKTTTGQEICDLKSSLETTTDNQTKAEEEASALEKRLSEAKQNHTSATNSRDKEIQRLERELKSSKTETKTHKDSAIRFAEDLRKSRDDHKSTKHSLQEIQDNLISERASHAKTKTTLGTVAILAEDLKVEKRGLERALEKETAAKTEAESVADALRKQLADLRKVHESTKESLQSELSARIEDLEGANRSVEVLQVELKSAERSLRESNSDQTSLRTHLSTMELGRHELLDRRSELEEALEEARDDLRRTWETLASTQATLEKAALERDTLRNQRQTYLLSSEREAKLETELSEQKKAFEDRLRDIHAILGLKFTTVFQTEVQEIRKNAVGQMPKSFRVPLLLQHRPQQRPVKSV
mmetsp:Transcript_13866/g.32315  ORF Transcript_13866/g.32315 Transcript_13866/m.32315 type:complete len:446 (+) Transcript_13866:206-1543(+)